MKGEDDMRYDFTENDIKNESNKLYFEEDDVMLDGEFIEGDGKHFVLTGSAVIDGEKYHDFETEFEIADGQKHDTAYDIMNAEWLWYDYKC
jgi:hypothetical protein